MYVFISFSCGGGVCIPAKQYCDFRKDCANGVDEKSCPAKCDFETDECKWKDNKIGNHVDWTRTTGSSLHNGPSVDHTLGTSSGK